MSLPFVPSNDETRVILAVGPFGDFSDARTIDSIGLSVKIRSHEDYAEPTDVDQLECPAGIWMLSLDFPETSPTGYDVYRRRKYSVENKLPWGLRIFANSITFQGAVDVQGCDDLVSLDAAKKVMTAKEGYLLHYRCTAMYDTISIWKVGV
jgi:hypothetical protein